MKLKIIDKTTSAMSATIARNTNFAVGFLIVPLYNIIMQFIDAIENSLRDLFARAPHLSDGLRKWIAQNLWWIVAITAVLLTVYAVYLIFASIFWGFASVFTLHFGGLFAVGGLWIQAIFCAIMAVVAMAAVSGLQKKSAQGWRGVFVLWLFFALMEILTLLANFGLANLFWTAFVVAFFAYAIYEPRDYFFVKKPKKSAKNVVEAEIVKPSKKLKK